MFRMTVYSLRVVCLEAVSLVTTSIGNEIQVIKLLVHDFHGEKTEASSF